MGGFGGEAQGRKSGPTPCGRNHRNKYSYLAMAQAAFAGFAPINMSASRHFIAKPVASWRRKRDAPPDDFPRLVPCAMTSSEIFQRFEYNFLVIIHYIKLNQCRTLNFERHYYTTMMMMMKIIRRIFFGQHFSCCSHNTSIQSTF